MSAPPPRRKADPPPAMRLPRGIRNHNPGNILRSPSVTWQGQAPAAAQTDPEFVVFTAPEWGLRAICRILISYRDRHAIRTPGAIAHRWAPPQHRLPDGRVVPNHTDAYARALAAAVGASTDTILDVRDPAIMGALLAAIVRQENGQQPYGPELLRRAMDLAGLDVPAPPPPANATPTT